MFKKYLKQHKSLAKQDTKLMSNSLQATTVYAVEILPKYPNTSLSRVAYCSRV